MTARGAADFLTRATSILGGLFIVLSIVLAAIAGVDARSRPTVDTSLAKDQPFQPAGSGAGAGSAGDQPRRLGNETAPAVPLAQ